MAQFDNVFFLSEQDHCYYEGYIQNDADSRASISACKGLR